MNAEKSELNDELLAHCASEAIHVPRFIQPHGHLLAFDALSSEVRFASAAAPELFGLNADDFLGQDLRNALDPFNLERLVAAVGTAPLSPSTEPFLLRLGGVEFQGTLHRQAELLVLELEIYQPPASSSEFSLARTIRRLQQAANLQELLAVAVNETRALTSCDRVVVYQFDTDGHGAVLAEEKADDMPAYLGLHFPASDIPAQARELYRKTWLRSIPDVDYIEVPVLADGARPPLDMSFASLRSMSPVHREYMRNMGLGASMSISLIHDQQLWGLISCGHRTPMSFSPEVRSACVTLGRLLSVQIAALEGLRRSHLQAQKDGLLSPLVEAMNATPEEVLAGLDTFPLQLLQLPEASGAAVLIDKKVRLYGTCPPEAEVVALADWALQRLDGAGCFATSSLSAEYPEGRSFTGPASGLLMMSLPKPGVNAVMWFRPEVSNTVKWAGEPLKHVVQDEETGHRRLGPRHSFREWNTTVHGQSIRWGSDDRYAARELRRSAIEIDLGAQVALTVEALASREELLAVISHDLRSPLSVVGLQATILLRTFTGDSSIASRRVVTATQSIQRAVAQMDNLLSDLLDMSLIDRGGYDVLVAPVKVAHLFEDADALLHPIADAKYVKLSFAAPSGIAVMVDAERFYQVISNLVGNAVKFTPEGGTIHVEASANLSENFVQFTVADTGKGILPDELERVFDLFWRSRHGNPTGFGLGLHIARGVIEAHGGHIDVTSEPGVCTTFRFTLPKAQLS